MAERVQRAEGFRETIVELTAAVGARVPDDDLVGLGSEIGLLGIDQGLGVVNRLEALDLEILACLGEQLTALGDLFDEVVPADGLPLALAALAR